MKALFFIYASVVFSVSVFAQHNALDDGANDFAADAGNAKLRNQADNIRRQQANFQLQENINSINNNYNERIGAQQTQIAELNLRLQSCAAEESAEIGSANSRADEAKSNAITGLLGQTIGPLTESLGKFFDKESEMQAANLVTRIDTFNDRVDDTFAEFNINKGHSSDYHRMDTGVSSLSFISLKSQCRLQPDTNSQIACGSALESLQNQNESLNNLAARHNVNGNTNNTAMNLLNTGAPLAMGAYGYNIQKTGAESTRDSQIQSAAYNREQCEASTEIALNEAKRQLASLQSEKTQSLDSARKAAGIANQVLNAQIAQERLQDSYGDDPNVIVDPTTLPDDDGLNPDLAIGPKVDDPEKPNDNSKKPLGFAQNATNSDKAGGSGGGGGGGSGGGGGGGTPWTYGSSYPGFPGGGGLPDQPNKGKYTSTGGAGSFGGGFGGGFNNAKDAFNSFAQWGAGQGQARSLSAKGDGGLLVLLQRARLRMSAHAAELLTDNHVSLISKNKNPQEEDAKLAPTKTVQRSTASRLR